LLPISIAFAVGNVASRTIRDFLAYSAMETIERKLRGFVCRVPKVSAYSRKARTATKQPALQYWHETNMPSRTAHIR
jgi:hypothetical protein